MCLWNNIFSDWGSTVNMHMGEVYTCVCVCVGGGVQFRALQYIVLRGRVHTVGIQYTHFIHRFKICLKVAYLVQIVVLRVVVFQPFVTTVHKSDVFAHCCISQQCIIGMGVVCR